MFFLFGFISPDVPGVQIDTAIFNAVFIAINIYQIVRLLKKMVPPVLDSKEEIHNWVDKLTSKIVVKYNEEEEQLSDFIFYAVNS